MKPFIEVDGAVFIVVDWEPDQEERQRYEIRRLTEKGKEIYREILRESEVELHQNFISG